MERPAPDSDETLPQWLREELSAQPPPSEQTLRGYDYMKGDFIAAIRAAGLARRQAGAVDAVFSLAGRLIDWAEGIVAEMTAADGHVQPAVGATRGLDATAQAEPAARRRAVGRIARVYPGARVEAATYRSGDSTEIELNALDAADGSELRPLQVASFDGRGHRIAQPVRVDIGEQAPRFPDPTAGEYFFVVSWAGGLGKLRIEFR